MTTPPPVIVQNKYAGIQQPLALVETGNMVVNWREWLSAFNFFLIASGRDQASDLEKCAVFLHVIGKYGREIYQEFDLKESELKYDTLVKKFKERFDPKKNVNFERHVFFETYQKDRAFDDYLSDLKIKSKSCEFEALRESLILTQMIRGLRYVQLRERLLAKTSLVLEDGVASCRAAERASSQAAACGVRELPAATATVALEEAVARGGSRGGASARGRRSRGRRGTAARPGASSSRGNNSCAKCGGFHATSDKCPAYHEQCYRCERMGHFAKFCNAKIVRELLDCGEGETEDSGELFVDTLSVEALNNNIESWYETISVNGASIKFKLDSGADTSIISYKTFKEAGFEDTILTQTNTVLKEISKNRLPVLGCFKATLSYKSVKTLQKIFVLDVVCNNLLGLKACTDLQLISRINELSQYKPDDQVFEGIGCLPSPVRISVDETVPPVVSTSRKIPLRLRPRLKEELDNMEKKGIIIREEGPTEWVSGLVLVEKPDKKLRLCLDPFHLNKAVRRSHFQLPTLDEIASEMHNARIFSKIDANKGFWMLKLDTYSSKLCTFATPFGRYRFLRMPFGISCAPEIFHSEMYKLFKAVGTVCYIDDILVFGRTKEEHDERLKKVLEKAKENGVKFNKEKCVFGASEVNYLGHIFSPDGIRPDNKRVDSIVNMPVPSNKKELERFLGIVNYLARFIPNYSEITASLRDLIKKENEFVWDHTHTKCFEDLKQRISRAPVLRFYASEEEVTVSVDASSRGLGACLVQGGQPVAYAARTLTPSETRWAQIEKELLAIVFGCQRFHQYIYGHKRVIVETDHKPLETIFRKPLNSTPAKLQRMLMKLQGYALEIRYKPGKEMHIADALSRAPTEEGSETDIADDVTVHVNAMMQYVNVSKEKQDIIKQEIVKDETLRKVQGYIEEGWPNDKKKLDGLVTQYWTVRHELHEINGLIFKNNQVVIPKSLRREMLIRIHEGHLGIEKCKRRAKEVVWWPGMSADIEQTVQRCDTCARHRAAQRWEPLQPHVQPDLPWQVLAVDIFDFDGKHYLLVVDYYSKYVEVAPLGIEMTSATTIAQLKNMFARFGIPKTIVSDNGPQFRSREFKEFEEKWGFEHTTSSPLYPRSNGLAERNIQTVKRIMTKAHETGQDWQIGLLNFRNTPLAEEEYSPAQLLMGRRLNTRLPTTVKSLTPKTVQPSEVTCKREAKITKMKDYHDRSTRTLAPLSQGEPVRIRDGRVWVSERVQGIAWGDRSYWVTTDDGRTYRRNRVHILSQRKDCSRNSTPNTSKLHYDDVSDNSTWAGTLPQPSTAGSPCQAAGSASTEPTGPHVTRSGRQVRSPQRYIVI